MTDSGPTPLSELLEEAVKTGEPTDPARAKKVAERALESEVTSLDEDRQVIAEEMNAPGQDPEALQDALNAATQAHLDALAEQHELSRADTLGELE